jgi:hypothetical protein
MWIRALAAVATISMASAGTAADRVVDVTSVAGVAALLREAGYKAEIKKDKQGEGYIESGVNGSGVQLIFYGCTNDKECDSFEFYSWYKKEAFFSADMANEWNAKKRFLKIAIDKDGDVAEYLYVSALGGMTYDNFKDYIDWYGSMDTELGKFLAEKRKEAGGGKPGEPTT